MDGIRATVASPDVGLDQGVKSAIWGYSGGATAAGWGGALHKTYAPEVNLVGVAHGGTPANLTTVAQNLEGGLYGGREYGSLGIV